mmetsp:Transcript_7553/g.15374  ORF Transcript_7553/g.15374 Transcript_7553/m.15374 type:complete len:229 (-) Transcript_7553:655-1341(-)
MWMRWCMVKSRMTCRLLVLRAMKICGCVRTSIAGVKRQHCVPSMASLKRSTVRRRASCSTTCVSSSACLRTACCVVSWIASSQSSSARHAWWSFRSVSPFLVDHTPGSLGPTGSCQRQFLQHQFRWDSSASQLASGCYRLATWSTSDLLSLPGMVGLTVALLEVTDSLRTQSRASASIRTTHHRTSLQCSGGYASRVSRWTCSSANSASQRWETQGWIEFCSMAGFVV